MFELNGQPITIEKKEKDQFDDFIREQKEARARGEKFTYGDYQTLHYKQKDIPKKQEEFNGIMRCRDCKHFTEDKYRGNRCAMKPYTKGGKRRFYPNKSYQVCKTFFEPK